MTDLGNKYAMHALTERRAALAGEIKTAERHLRHLRTSLMHLDGTLRIMSPDFDPKSIAAKRPYKRVKLFGQGKLNLMILDALRRAGRPMATAEVIAAVVETMKFGPDAAREMAGRVRSNLTYLVGRGIVVKEGERETAGWSLTVLSTGDSQCGTNVLSE